MQEASVKGWMHESHVPAELFESVRELNHRFLDLLATPSSRWVGTRHVGLSTPVLGQVVPLSVAQKKAVASCPYALFDLRFHDDAYWQTRLLGNNRWGVADELVADQNTLDFVRLALFFAWHVAATGKLAAQFLLGMNEGAVARFRVATIDRLPALVSGEAANLTARWGDCPAYWTALTSAARGRDATGLRRVQLYGLQLAAASHLP